MGSNIHLRTKVFQSGIYSYFQPMQYVLLTLSWTAYFLHHSFFASDKAKKWLLKFGLTLKSQRIIYTIFSIFALLLILLFNGIIGGEKLLAEHRLLKGFALFLAAGGVFLIREAFKSYNIRSFLWLDKDSHKALNTTGILQYVRHPLYSATILIFVGFFLYDSRLASLISLICVLAYLPIGIWLEDKKLIKEYGDQYKSYANKVPPLIPDFRNR